jgi:hypothetical protein
MVQKMDDACRAVGRDPETLSRSLEAVVRTPPARDGEPPDAKELRGSPNELAATLVRYADLRIQHLAITVHPQTVEGVRAFEPVIQAMTARTRERVSA